MNKTEILLFWLDNNKADFLNKLIALFPYIQLEPFFKQNDSTSNEEFAKELTAYFDGKKLWGELAKIRVKYNKQAQNYTTEEAIYNQVSLYNGVKPIDRNTQDFDKSAMLEKSFWTDFGGFLGGTTGGSEQSTSTTTTKANTGLIVGSIFGLVALLFVVYKIFA